MGVPTVVDAMTLAADLLGREEAGMEEEISPRGEPMVGDAQGNRSADRPGGQAGEHGD